MSHYTLGEDAARFGVVSFNHLATLRVNFSHNAAEIDAGIDEMTASGSTSISSGFLMTRQLFADHARVNATKIALLLSDGQDGGAVATAALVKGDNVTVFAWGFGGANLVQLEQLASDPSKAVLGTDLSDLTSYLAPLQAAVCALPPPSLPPSPPTPPPPCRYLGDGQLDDKTDQKHCPPPPPSPPPPSLPPPPCLTDLTTGIADWKLLDDGSSAPTTTPPGAWYEPTGQGKWLGQGQAQGGVNKSYGYTLSFEVNPPALPFPLLTSNL